MPHSEYRSGLVNATANPRSSAFACRTPPTSSKVTVGRICVSPRPVRSPNFSPSFAKTSSRRRWSAHSWSLPFSRSAMALDGRLAARAPRAGLLEDTVLDEHRRLGADRERDRIGGTGIELHGRSVCREGDRCVVWVGPEAGDYHA